MKYRTAVAVKPRLVKSERRPLGDMLQRLASIAPRDLYAMTDLTRDVLREAERRHQRFFHRDRP